MGVIKELVRSRTSTSTILTWRCRPFRKKGPEIKSRQNLKHHSEKLFKNFDKQLRLTDFSRRYKQADVRPLKEPTREEYAAIFARLHKNTPASQNLNCAACGYQTCRDMAKAIFNQLDRPEDCMDYNRKEVIRENENLEEKNQEIRRMLAEITQLSTDHQKRAAELTQADAGDQYLHGGSVPRE